MAIVDDTRLGARHLSTQGIQHSESTQFGHLFISNTKAMRMSTNVQRE
jgi:hypothetical protein